MQDRIDPKILASWMKLTTPEVLSSNLIRASLFLVAWELLKNSLIKRLRDFFASEFRQGEWLVSEAYRTKVLSLDKDALTASCLWFKDMGALTDEDMSKVRKARTYRNAIAHDLPNFLGSFDREIEDEQLLGVQELLVKVDRWWLREFEIPTDPEFAGQDIPDEEISSGNMLMLSLILDVLSGNHAYRDFLEQAYGRTEGADAKNSTPPPPSSPSEGLDR
jgi:hypothetical protein